MSAGYWGIVIGLAALVAMLFLCIELLYSQEKEAPRTSMPAHDGSTETAERPALSGRRAA